MTKPDPHSDSLPKPKFLVAELSSDNAEGKRKIESDIEWSGESETGEVHLLRQDYGLKLLELQMSGFNVISLYFIFIALTIKACDFYLLP